MMTTRRVNRTQLSQKIFRVLVLLLLIGSLSFFVMSPFSAMAQESPVRWEGAVTQINPSEDLITLRVSGNLEKLVRGKQKFTADNREVSSRTIRPGDRINARFSPGMEVSSPLQVTADYFAGEVLFVNKEKMILTEGRMLHFTPDSLFLKNGKPAAWNDISMGLRVYARVDPVTNLAGTIEAVDLRGAPQVSRELAVTGIAMGVYDSKGVKKIAPYTLARGGKITLQITGTPGRKASFDIAGIARHIPMNEIKPGTYRGEYTLDRGDARRSYVLVRLTGEGEELVRVNPESVDIAVSPPRIRPITPAPGAVNSQKRPSIYAELVSPGSLIVARAVNVYLDGKLLTSGVEKNVGFVLAELPGDLAPGEHSVKVVAEDEAGNRFSETWKFSVR